MIHIRVRTTAAVAGLAIPAVFASSVLGEAPSRPVATHRPTLTIARAGLFEHATLGSFCVQPPPVGGVSNGQCADAGAPLPMHGRLPVRPGGRVVVRPSVAARVVQAGLIRVHGSEVTHVGGRLHVRRLSARKWAVELPARLGRANVLDVFIGWNDRNDGRGDADFWGGIRAGCR